MHKFLIVLAMLALAGCTKAPESMTRVNQNFEVERLFTHEGCTVYRFTDSGYNRYFTNCSGSTTWSENCGKNCSRSVGID